MRQDQIVTVSLDKASVAKLTQLAEETAGGNKSLVVRRLVAAAKPEDLKLTKQRAETPTAKG